MPSFFRIDMLYEGTRDWYPNLKAMGVLMTREESLEKGKIDMEKYCPIFEKVIL